MNGKLVDRLARALSDRVDRRSSLGAFATSAVASSGLSLPRASDAKKKRRCRKRRQACGGKKKCCGGDTACREFPTASCLTLTGKRCCGLEGAVCDNAPEKNHCDCCDGLFCSGVEGLGHCQEEPT